jgi:hypothetical protein
VEVINGRLEIMGRNSGGTFHSEDIARLNLGLAISPLRRDAGDVQIESICAGPPQLNAMFQSRF